MLDEKPEPTLDPCPDGKCQDGWHFFEQLDQGEYATVCQCGTKHRSVME